MVFPMCATALIQLKLQFLAPSMVYLTAIVACVGSLEIFIFLSLGGQHILQSLLCGLKKLRSDLTACNSEDDSTKDATYVLVNVVSDRDAYRHACSSS